MQIKTFTQTKACEITFNRPTHNVVVGSLYDDKRICSTNNENIQNIRNNYDH